MLVMDSLESFHLKRFFRLVKRRAEKVVVSLGRDVRAKLQGIAAFNFGSFWQFRRFGNPKDSVYLLINFFAYPTPPIEAFVASKGPSAIRQDCHRPVEVHFSLRSALESGSIFLAVRIGKFTF